MENSKTVNVLIIGGLFLSLAVAIASLALAMHPECSCPTVLGKRSNRKFTTLRQHYFAVMVSE